MYRRLKASIQHRTRCKVGREIHVMPYISSLQCQAGCSHPGTESCGTLSTLYPCILITFDFIPAKQAICSSITEAGTSAWSRPKGLIWDKQGWQKDSCAAWYQFPPLSSWLQLPRYRILLDTEHITSRHTDNFTLDFCWTSNMLFNHWTRNFSMEEVQSHNMRETISQICNSCLNSCGQLGIIWTLSWVIQHSSSTTLREMFSHCSWSLILQRFTSLLGTS